MRYASVQSLGSVRFLNVFERSYLCLPRLHLFNQNKAEQKYCEILLLQLNGFLL